MKGRNGTLTVTPTRVSISRKGPMGFVSQGIKGVKEIDLRQISSVQFRKNRLGTAGYIQFAFLGGQENQGGLFNAVSDENSIIFGKGREADFLKAKELVDQYRDALHAPSPATPSTSGLDDLERLAVLREKGIVTQEEFDAKKKQLLGI